MKNSKFISKVLAHEAIQTYAFNKLIAEEEYICDMKYIPYKKPNIKNLTPRQRKFMINIMKELGTAGCIIDYSDKEYSFSDFLKNPLPTHHFVRDNNDSWTWVNIFSKEEIEEYIAHFCPESDMKDICMCYDSGDNYNGPGRSFTHTGYVKVTRNRIIHKQYGGLDI